MGGIFKQDAPPRDDTLEKQMEAERLAEEERAAALEAANQKRKNKVARGIIGQRSLFGQAGGRGFFG